jgi:DNA-directed RNA polymerase specialized sigma24 family protein
MDHERVVQLPAGGNVRAFVELTKHFQHFAFGSALSLLHDFQLAEDVVQEAFGVDRAAEPSRQGGVPWLVASHRTPPRPSCRSAQTRSDAATLGGVADETAALDDQLEHRQQTAKALAAIAALPASLREPAMLFFVHDCSHQDIATFLKLPVATVNNRLHAARVQLKRRMLTMVSQTLQAHGLPNNFADRIGRLIEVRGNVADALFHPSAMPDILAELEVSDEANRRGVNVQVVQRLGAGRNSDLARRCIAAWWRNGGVAQRSVPLHHGNAALDTWSVADCRANCVAGRCYNRPSIRSALRARGRAKKIASRSGTRRSRSAVVSPVRCSASRCGGLVTELRAPRQRAPEEIPDQSAQIRL